MCLKRYIQNFIIDTQKTINESKENIITILSPAATIKLEIFLEFNF